MSGASVRSFHDIVFTIHPDDHEAELGSPAGLTKPRAAAAGSPAGLTKRCSMGVGPRPVILHFNATT
eukprot:scaffold111108_cov33-Phaeocystis_antarctica.AAC.2